MELKIKPSDYIVPSYSLTGDLLSYLRCGLQYRYHNGSSLPPSRPVQLWFGEFLHGTLEMCYQFWRDQHQSEEREPPFPWPCTQRIFSQDPPEWIDYDIGKFGNTVEESLKHQGKQARSTAARDSAYERLQVTVNELCPHLFPLIKAAEQKVIGTRPVPQSSADLRCDSYEVHGVIDVLTHMTLSSAATDNPIRRYVAECCPDLPDEFEVIVDYKGTRRPLTNEPIWHQGNWQVQTYAWLRQQQPESFPVAAGILIYINELLPGSQEIRMLKQGMNNGTTDVTPEPGSRDERLIRLWRQGDSTRQLSSEYRMRRAIRVVPISSQSINTSLTKFDEIVRTIEEHIVKEAAASNILDSWNPSCRDEATCAACDFRYFCPKPHGRSGPHAIKNPLYT